MSLPDHTYLFGRYGTFIIELAEKGLPAVTLSEQHVLSLKKSTYPLESREMIVDHAVREPTKLKLDAIVTNVVFPRRKLDVAALGYVGFEERQRLAGETEERHQLVATNKNARERETASRRRFAEYSWVELAKLVDSRALMTVYSNAGKYENMLITKAQASMDNSTGDALSVELDLEEVLVWEAAPDDVENVDSSTGAAETNTGLTDSDDVQEDGGGKGAPVERTGSSGRVLPRSTASGASTGGDTRTTPPSGVVTPDTSEARLNLARQGAIKAVVPTPDMAPTELWLNGG